MRGMKWTHEEFVETPSYVTRFCADFLGIISQHQADQADKRQRDTERQAQAGR